jgi:integrase
MSTQDQAGGFEKVGECLYRYASTGVYYARVKVNGKEFRRSLKTDDRAFAKRKLAELRAELERVDPHAGRVTVGELLTRFLASRQHLAPKTVEKQTHMGRLFSESWKPGLSQQVRDVRPSQVLEWLGGQSHRISKSYYNDFVHFIRAMFALAVSDRVIIRSPAEEAKRFKRDTPIRDTPNWEQYKAIVKSIREQVYSADAEKSADFAEFLGLSGLGNSEAANLVWGDIDFEAGRIRVYRNKTDTGFVIPIFPQLRPFLECLRGDEQRAHNERVFKVQNIKKALANACRRLKFANYSHRALRRCFITRAVELGLDFKTVAALQGHRDGGVLIAKTYSHLRNEHVENMAARLTE